MASASRLLSILALDDTRLVETSRIPADDETVGKGLVSEAMLALSVLLNPGRGRLPDDAVFRPIHVPAAAGAGLRVERCRNVLRISESSNAGLQVSSTGAAGEAFGRRAVPAVVYLDLAIDAVTEVHAPRGTVAFGHADDGTPIAARLSSDIAISAPVLDWCAGRNDSWLTRVIEQRLAGGGAWAYAVAAGMYARLLRSDSPEELREAVSWLREGRIVGFLTEALRPSRWIKALSSGQVAYIGELALAEVDRLHNEIDDLDVTLHTYEDEWLEQLQYVCRLREELAGVESLLWYWQRNEALSTMLESLDARATQRLGLPALDAIEEELAMMAAASEPIPVAVTSPLSGVLYGDEWLRRVAALDPFAWWGVPAHRSRA